MDENYYYQLLDNMYDGVYFVDLNNKITFWNKGAERITGYTKAEITGLRCSDNLLMHVDNNGTLLCTGACPLSKTINDGCLREVEVYLHHKEGHRVPVNIRVTPIRDRSGLIIGAVEIFSDNTQKINLEQELDQYRQLALIDSLTGLGNRRYAEMNLHNRLNEMYSYSIPSFGIMFLDIDFFKKVNDVYGHDNGDRVLRMLSLTLKNGIREYDLACRWGGEEFIAIIQSNSRDIIYTMAEKLRLLVKGSGFRLGTENVQVTVSIGATRAELNDTMESLIKRADKLLYESKKSGRNRVSMG